MALSGKLDEVGEADRWIWERLGRIWERLGCWTAFGIIVMLLGILTAWTAFGTKESESALRSKAQKNGNPLEAFKALFQNDQLLWVALSYLLYAIANVATTGVLIFLFKFVLDNQAVYSVTGIIALVAGLIMAPLYPILDKRIPRRYLYIGGMISMIAGYILLGIFANNMIMVFVALVLFYVPGTLIQMTAILSLTDAIEYGQLKNGKRNEAVNPVCPPDARQDRWRPVERHRRLHRRCGRYDRQRHCSRHDRREHPHLRSLLLLCAARPDRAQPAGVHVQGEDQREDARRNRRAARSQARGR